VARPRGPPVVGGIPAGLSRPPVNGVAPPGVGWPPANGGSRRARELSVFVRSTVFKNLLIAVQMQLREMLRLADVAAIQLVLQLELGRIQTHMTQKQMLRVEVGAVSCSRCACVAHKGHARENRGKTSFAGASTGAERPGWFADREASWGARRPQAPMLVDAADAL
jgi:hypothetical protein